MPEALAELARRPSRIIGRNVVMPEPTRFMAARASCLGFACTAYQRDSSVARRSSEGRNDVTCTVSIMAGPFLSARAWTRTESHGLLHHRGRLPPLTCLFIHRVDVTGRQLS